jgi:alpha-L-fucosidase
MKVSTSYKKIVGGLLFLFCFIGVVRSDVKSSWPYEEESVQQRDDRMHWWRNARFGLFIHWGVYSVPAGTYKGEPIKGIGEWIMNRGKIPVAEYKEFAKSFNPVNYDPDAWVRLAKEAGMKYIVITSKHHDGFALFDSSVTDWDVVDATPYGKDLLKPLAEACRNHGIKLGFYYSQAQDWCHPGGSASGGHWDKAQEGDMDEYIRKISAPQVREILTNYGDVAVLWWDTPVDMNNERADLLQPLINLQPGILTNNRLAWGYEGDLKTPEQHIPATGLDSDWESCMTMNRTWGYKSYDDEWKSSPALIRNLVDIASKGGNYLLNVGPTSKGEIPQPSVERLKEIGKWMRVNSESIYGTTASPFVKLDWGRCTKKEYINGTTLYFHVFDWPEDGKIEAKGLNNEVVHAYFMADMQHRIKTEKTDSGVVFHLPEEALDDVDTVIVATIKGTLDVERLLPRQDENGVVLLSADEAYIHNRGYGPKTKLVTRGDKKHIGHWSDAKSWINWLFIVDKPGTFEVVGEMAVKDKTEYVVSVDWRKLEMQTDSTGGYDSFKEILLGEMKIPKAGEYSFQIKPVINEWKPINLRSITLRPVK